MNKQKTEIEQLSRKLDKLKHKEQTRLSADSVDAISPYQEEMDVLETEIARLRQEVRSALSDKAKKLMNMPFHRAITKKEQADMGAFKKSLNVKVEIIHPMTALGREMALKEVTGFAAKSF
jgi:ribosome-associated protein